METSLKERVEYLAQAIVALNSTQKVAIKDEVSELNDKKDVALLQASFVLHPSLIVYIHLVGKMNHHPIQQLYAPLHEAG